jgi:hypothetical protein
MAQQVNVRLIDDLDEEETAAETVRFSVGDRAYVIDLSEQHVKELHEALAPYIRHARPAGTRPKVTKSRASRRTSDPAENRRIREWANKVGILLSNRGRIPDNVLAQYRQRDQVA